MNIESLEGWQSLLDKRDKVDGDPEKIRSIAAAWRTASDLTDYTDDVAAAVRDVDNAWHGQSADAFVSYMGRFSTAGQGLSAALSTCASNLSDVAQALEDAKSSIDTIISNTRTAASEYATNHPDATDEQLRSHFTSLLTTANNDAQEHLDNAKTAVSDATTAITGSIDGDYTTQTGSFSTIPDPASQEFTPRKGIPFDWKPTPGYQPPTDPAGYTPTGYNPNGYTPTTSYAAYTGEGGVLTGYGPSGPPPPGGGPAPTGQVREWIEQAVAILRRHGYPMEKMNINDIWLIIRHESGGNPHAINNWDSNAARGTPSKGLMQTIDPTFNRWALPGHRDIWNPVDNIIAGVRYAIERYGSVSNVPGVIGVKNGTGYRGY
ncbi:transglycosylase SLT domain-containing protein [Thermostaphylospora chromogena]|uniref:WXG100 family type VII secretion target n=1 Tax=Thermostaphylospora chromogena TaxID=35622 RepID=A0A1H1ATV7_9ACTN|nr:transglycosylase SLT domain-containing protein [Thermostaphylospora chromogena]SDQ43135.1 WXG100 family type VII secretion target [Thermostaphylospora chromogena]